MILLANLFQVIKQVAQEAAEAGDPSTFLYGTVKSADPLQIQIDSKTYLDNSFLILTKSVMDYELIVEVDQETEVEGGHKHKYIGKKTYKVKNALKVEDMVILIKQKGGQKYIVLDKIEGGKS